MTDPLEWSEAITTVLEKLADFYGAERAYLAVPMDGGRSASFYEWHQEGAAFKETLKTRLRRPEQLTTEERAELCRIAALEEFQYLEAERLELYQDLQAQGVCACYVLALLDSDDKIIAYLGVDNPSRNRGRLEFLTALRQFLSSNLSRRLIEQEQADLSDHELRRDMQMIYPNCLSIGYAWADSEIRLTSLMEHADEHMLVAKQSYHKDMSVLTKGHDPLLRQNLQRDIAQGVYRLFLQPKADAATGRIIGAEA